MKTTNLTREVYHRLIYGMHEIFESGARRANNQIGNTEEEKRDGAVQADGGYKCIHSSPDYFCSIVGQVLNRMKIKHGDLRKLRKLKFLDIGCGVGEKVYLAALFKMDAYGLELRRPLIDEGIKLLKEMGIEGAGLLGSNEKCFIQGNALTYDYHEFDILYFFCPLMDRDLQIKLELRIAETAKKGAVVIPMMAQGCFGGYEQHPIKGWRLVVTNDARYYIKQKMVGEHPNVKG